MDYTERLQHLANNDARAAEGSLEPSDVGIFDLDGRTMSLVRLAALIAVGGAVPSYGALVDDAVGAGATAPEIVDVLEGIVSIVGLPCVVAAAPRVALALGYDTDDAFESQPGG